MRPSGRNVLLTGAGFTKNFCGLLGREVWDRILNDPGVRMHRRVVDLLVNLEPDFESAYSSVLNGDYSDEEKIAISNAVERVFAAMDETIRTFNRWQDAPCLHGCTDLIRSFSGGPEECGYFFTLNQDLFIERRILDKTQVDAEGHLWPLGIRHRSGFNGPFLDSRRLDREEWKHLPTKTELSEIQENAKRHTRFAYVKLHGSTAWYGSTSREAMVIGGNKAGQIEKEPLLSWYFDLFREVMLERRHRLFVIGYGFRDPHVNQVLASAIEGPGLDIAVLSTQSHCEFSAGLLVRQDAEERQDAELIRDCLLESGSRFYRRRLIDVFPPDATGDKTRDWNEIREYLSE